MNTEIKSAESFLDEIEEGVHHPNFWAAIKKAMEAYHNQFKSEPNEVLDKAIEWCNKGISNYNHFKENGGLKDTGYASIETLESMKTYLQSLKQ